MKFVSTVPTMLYYRIFYSLHCVFFSRKRCLVTDSFAEIVLENKLQFSLIKWFNLVKNLKTSFNGFNNCKNKSKTLFDNLMYTLLNHTA